MYDMKNLTKLKKLGELAPEAFKGFVAFDEAAFKDGAIPLKYKELMAVAVALTTQCPYCIEIHAKKAKKAGATEQELIDFVRDRLAHFKAPRGVSFVDELPKTATGKIQKFVLRGGAAGIHHQ